MTLNCIATQLLPEAFDHIKLADRVNFVLPVELRLAPNQF